MSDGMGREPAYLSSHATNRYFIPNWGIELDYFSCGRFIVVSQDTTVCVFSFPKILHTIHPFLSLNHKSVCFTLPLFNEDRAQFKLNAIDFLSPPASESKNVIVFARI